VRLLLLFPPRGLWKRRLAPYEVGHDAPVTELHSGLHVDQHGRDDGPDLLLVHGLTDSGDGWAHAIAHWGDRYRVTTMDLRGHGRSPRFTPAQLESHPGDLMVEDVTQLLEQLDRPVVLGHSLGGAVALTVGSCRPELVRALVLEDPAPRAPHEAQRDPGRGRGYHEGLQPSRAAADDEALLRLRREAHPDWPEQELLPTGRAEQQTQEDYLVHGDWKPTTPWPDLVAGLQVPTLLITGDDLDEVIVSPGLEDELRAAAPDLLDVRRLDRAGHCVRRDRHDIFYAVVDDWIATLP
jgi:pimeloyl-ACP methyl ester carboxylesterase